MINIRIDGPNRAAVIAAYQLLAQALHAANVRVSLDAGMGSTIREVNVEALKSEGAKLEGL